MVLTALDDNVPHDAADSTENQEDVMKQSRESVENEAELSIVVSSDDEEETGAVVRAKQPPHPAAAPSGGSKKQAASQQQQQQQAAARRRRRRSSARFLRLTGRFEEEQQDEDDDEPQLEHPGQEHLGEMYKRAIRMNAENRINAGNSWGLRLIENIDKFLVDDEQQHSEGQRVNFTKASCTLDASVKIYSYRVDDVHLTSYKVLANLNRTETGKKQQNRTDQDEGDDGDNDTNTRTNKKSKSSNERHGVTETLESNVANLNMSKLDSAFDIDPLFHKMSKTFDEGGAKGLLLVNLGVGTSGCNIVFDSKEEATSIASQETPPPNPDADNSATVLRKAEGMIDISSLNTKLDSLLNGESIQSIPLVPQLQSLRQEYEQLEKEGFVDYNVPKTNSRRYATSREEEKEAEMSIHQEALERSRASQGTLAQHQMPQDDEEEDEYAADDFGGGDDDDDDDADFGFSDFIAADENGQRYSSISFQDEAFVDDGAPLESKANTTALLDAICSGNALGGSNDYEFFNTATVKKMTSGNVWAGSAHWKKTEKQSNKKKRAAAPKKKTKRSKKKKVAKPSGVIDFSKAPSLDDVLRTAPKNKRGTDPLQLSKANKTKYGKADNLLPPDAGIGIEQLSTLFLRPNTVLGKADEENHGKTKTVGFQDNVESFGAGFDYGGDDDSFGGDDDGPGFAFADSGEDDFVIGELDGVRKVDKIKVGYATVAKKVDVKRLKKDLWSELESTFAPPAAAGANKKDDSMDEDDFSTADAPKTPAPTTNEPKVLSFKDTVADMEAKQSQGDVTVPFYFICLLHLANEKGLRLESIGLEDFAIQTENGYAPSFGTLPNETSTGESSTTIAEQRAKRTKEVAAYVDSESDSDEGEDDDDDDETDSDSE